MIPMMEHKDIKMIVDPESHNVSLISIYKCCISNNISVSFAEGKFGGK